MSNTSSELTVEIVVCWECLEPLKEWKVVVTQDDTMEVWICQNVICFRYGLLSTTYRLKEKEGGEQNG